MCRCVHVSARTCRSQRCQIPLVNSGEPRALPAPALPLDDVSVFISVPATRTFKTKALAAKPFPGWAELPMPALHTPCVVSSLRVQPPAAVGVKDRARPWCKFCEMRLWASQEAGELAAYGQEGCTPWGVEMGGSSTQGSRLKS